jgi:hypothetical protein
LPPHLPSFSAAEWRSLGMLAFARKRDAIAISITATVDRVSIVVMQRLRILNSNIILTKKRSGG